MRYRNLACYILQITQALMYILARTKIQLSHNMYIRYNKVI